MKAQTLQQIPNFENLQIGKSYFETSSDYYIAKCIDINPEILNGDYNTYYSTATFQITTSTGRKLPNEKKSFTRNI